MSLAVVAGRYGTGKVWLGARRRRGGMVMRSDDEMREVSKKRMSSLLYQNGPFGRSDKTKREVSWEWWGRGGGQKREIEKEMLPMQR